MDIYLSYGVTALGAVLSIFWMVIFSQGKSIPGTEDKPETRIKFGQLELTTNSVLAGLIASLVTAVTPLSLQFVKYPNSTVSPEVTGESRCNSLKGLYKLYTDYVFIEEENIRDTVVTATGSWNNATTWKADTCEDKKDGSYVLKGNDISYHKIELIVNDKYEHVSTTVAKYRSEVLIDKNGSLITRTFQYIEEQEKPVLIKNVVERLKGKEEYIRNKMDDYEKIRDKRLADLRTKRCYPALFKNEATTMLAFACFQYTRAMERERAH